MNPPRPQPSAPLLRFVSCYIIGIVLARKRPVAPLPCLVIFFLLLFVIYLLLRYLSHRQRRQHPYLLGSLGLVLLTLAGMLTTLQQQPQHKEDHLIKHSAATQGYLAVVDTPADERNGRHRMVVRVQRLFYDGVWHKAQGRLRLSWDVAAGDEGAALPEVGTLLLVRGAPQTLAGSHVGDGIVNFFALRHIHHLHHVAPEAMRCIGEQRGGLYRRLTYYLRQRSSSLLRAQLSAPAARAITLALVLGIRQELSSKLRATYASVGAIHVLAVSGLHVGLLYMLLLLLFQLLQLLLRLPLQVGRVSALGMLWLYAGITGLAPSVLRTVIMCSLATLAQLLRRKVSSKHTLATSALILLLYDPLMLYDVGFQLSYAALLGILYLYPPLASSLPQQSTWLRRWAELSIVSLVAQVATAPLSLYYFHHFPLYFLPANWLVVPAAPVLLILGFLLLLTSSLPLLSSGIGQLLSTVIDFITHCLGLLGRLPCHLLGPFSPAVYALVLWCATLFALYHFLQQRKFSCLLLAALLSLAQVGLTAYIFSQERRPSPQTSAACAVAKVPAPGR